jgi:hypothetical protein
MSLRTCPPRLAGRRVFLIQQSPPFVPEFSGEKWLKIGQKQAFSCLSSPDHSLRRVRLCAQRTATDRWLHILPGALFLGVLRREETPGRRGAGVIAEWTASCAGLFRP